MKVEEMIKKYSISLCGDDKINCRMVKGDTAAHESIIAHKPEILAYLKAAAAEHAAKIAAIDGLDELRQAIYDAEKYSEEFTKMMDDEYNDGVKPPKKPKTDVDAVRKAHPQAAAYIKAENWSMASHYAKIAAGARALERITNGEDYKAAIEDMEKEWENHCDEHIWD